MKKANKNVLIRRHDYDFYTVRMPFRMIRKRERTLFVRRELEKRHPRFSEKCCADTKVSLHKDGLTAEIAVMDKLRLAAYKKDFPNRHLVLEGQPDRFVFKKTRTSGKAIALVLLAGAVLCGAQLIHQLRPADTTSLAAAQPTETAKADFLPPEQLLISVLAAVTRKGGRLSSVRWQGDTCAFAISGCHPEDVVSGERCTVSYKNSEPQFELALHAQKLSVTGAENALPSAEFVPAVRHELLSYGAVILSEHIADDALTLQLFVAHDALSTALKVCAEQAEVHGWSEQSFAVQSGANGCDAKITLGKGAGQYEMQSPLQTVATYAPLFIPALPDVPVRPRTAAVAASPVIARDKVGEIRRMDGSRFVYYRMSDGNIVCEHEKIGG